MTNWEEVTKEVEGSFPQIITNPKEVEFEDIIAFIRCWKNFSQSHIF